jgi:hypothetical protein
MQIEFFFHLPVYSLKQVEGLKKNYVLSTIKKRKKNEEEEKKKFFSILVKNSIE